MPMAMTHLSVARAGALTISSRRIRRRARDGSEGLASDKARDFGDVLGAGMALARDCGGRRAVAMPGSGQLIDHRALACSDLPGDTGTQTLGRA